MNINGLKAGEYKLYNKNGTLSEKGSDLDNKLNGEVELFNESGNPVAMIKEKRFSLPITIKEESFPVYL